MTDFVHKAAMKKEEYLIAQEKQSSLTEQKRKNFFKELRGKMIEDHNEGYDSGLLNKQNDYFILPDGTLTEKFKHDLISVKEEQMAMFQNSVETAKRAEPDLFGIKRRNCKICLEECAGYVTRRVLSASDSSEFPTFCDSCNCPAYFHEIESDQMKFPEELAEVLTKHSI